MGHADFRVGGKIFATLGPDADRAVVKLSPPEQALVVTAEPSVYEPVAGAWGRRGYTRIHLSAAAEPSVLDALWAAWRNTAPKRLVKRHAEGAP